MTGSGPLGKQPAGTFNFETPAPGKALYLEPTPKRIRVEVGGEVIADSRRAFLLHEGGQQPIYYFPHEDVGSEYLRPSDRHTHCPKKGDASYYTITAGGETVEAGAWYYPDPLPGAPPIKDLIAFYFNRMGRWLEEGEEIGVHPRDPYHRIDVIGTDRHEARRIDNQLRGRAGRSAANRYSHNSCASGVSSRTVRRRSFFVALIDPSGFVARWTRIVFSRRSPKRSARSSPGRNPA